MRTFTVFVTAPSSSSPAPSPLRRLLAAGAAALVLLLTVLAISPQLHAGFHAHDAVADAQNDDGCVISLFAGGLTAAPVPLTLAAPTAALVARTFAAPAEIFVSSPRALRPPERGPPQR